MHSPSNLVLESCPIGTSMRVTYTDIIKTYVRKRRQIELDELDFFQSIPTLIEAITKAGMAVDRRGKRQVHQQRLKKATLEKSRNALIQIQRRIRDAKNFDGLHTAIEQTVLPLYGIGELYVYDTALRIGAHLEKLPTKVYLHAGTRTGARRLGYRGRGPIELSELPKEFQSLPAHQVEDILCIYKNFFSISPAKGSVFLAGIDSALGFKGSCGPNLRKRRRC